MRDVFGGFGEISAVSFGDHDTVSVLFASAHDARRAVKSQNGARLAGCAEAIVVKAGCAGCAAARVENAKLSTEVADLRLRLRQRLQEPLKREPPAPRRPSPARSPTPTRSLSPTRSVSPAHTASRDHAAESPPGAFTHNGPPPLPA